MIFVTVGTQLPFPRLIDAMNNWATTTDEPVIAQTGPEPGNWPHLDTRKHLTPAEFEDLFSTARVIVAHAGIGTILSAKRLGKPLIIAPRRHALGEHRNDHQMATAAQVGKLPGIHVAENMDDLPLLLAQTDLTPANQEPSPSHQNLITRLQREIDTA